MVLKLRSMALILVLVMLFSGVACGKNLLLGGINQDKPVCAEPCSSTANSDYKKIAADLDAYYFPMYYSGQANDINEVLNAATGVATDQNGLTNAALKNTNYDTIIAYSGGTSTAVTALASQGVKCHTLILISPMRPGAGTIASAVSAGAEFVGVVPKGGAAITNDVAEYIYKQQIKQLLDKGIVQHIVVIQSPNDQLILGDLYQAKFSEGEISGIDVINVALETTGEQAHIDLFFKYTKDHLKLGSNGRVYYVPNDADSNPPTVQAFQVTPLSLTAGESFTIDYTISDNDGSGLKQVELWRKDEQSDWQEINSNTLSGETGPISGSFTDSPPASGKKWYGLHVVDNSGNWNDEQNSNTNNQPGNYGPFEVEIKSVQETGKQEIVHESSTSSSEWQYTGVADAVQGEYDIAIECFDKAIELDPSFIEAWYDKAIILSHQGKYDEAIYACNKVIELDSQSGRAWNCKGYALIHQGKYDDALLCLDKAIELNPKYGDAWHNKGDAFNGLNRNTEANDAFDKAKELGYTGPVPIIFGRYWSCVD